MSRKFAHRRRGVCRPLDEGAVTAETALAMPAVVLLMTAILAGLGWSAQLIRCQQAAGDIARAVARGESDADVAALAERLTPAGANVRTTNDGTSFTVRITWEPSSAVPMARLLPTVEAASTAAPSGGAS